MIDIEIEAKVVKALEGFNNEFSNYFEGLDEFRTAFKNGTATNQQLDNFNKAALNYAIIVSETYMRYKKTKGMPEADAKKAYGISSYTGNFKYAEKLYGKNMKAKAVEVEAPKN